MLFVIFLNCITLSLYNYEGLPNTHGVSHSSHGDDSLKRKQQSINYANIVFTVIYICEALIRVIADGLVLHQTSYMRSGWNVIDEIVIVTGILEFFIDPYHSVALRILRGLFRPLKSFNATPSKLLKASSFL